MRTRIRRGLNLKVAGFTVKQQNHAGLPTALINIGGSRQMRGESRDAAQ